MNNKRPISADEIYNATMSEVASLPCQQEYVRQLSAILAYHYRKNIMIDAGFSVDEIPYQGVLVVAPTGQGKTYLLKAITKVLDLNVITLDCTTLAHEGWKGSSLSQQLLASKKALNNDSKWEQSILFLDEFDKLHFYRTEKDQGNPMENILQLYNNSTIMAESDNKNGEILDTSRFTIILAGAFEGIQDIIKNRISPKKNIGFSYEEDSNSLSETEYIKKVTLEDLQKYGFMPELLGRISSIITIPPMKLEDYKCLLSGDKGSISYKYNGYFNFTYGIDFQIDESAINYISQKCEKEKTGARAVNPLINDVMRESFVLVDRDETINRIVLKANENGCYLHYEHGDRLFTPLIENHSIIKQSPYFLKGKTTTDIAIQLVDIYKTKESNLQYIEELHVYLNLALSYLETYCNLDDFTFASLEKLARYVRKSTKYEESVFDTIIIESWNKDDRDDTIKEYYKQFNKYWNKQTSSHLMIALNYIHNSLIKEYHSTVINFKLEQVA